MVPCCPVGGILMLEIFSILGEPFPFLVPQICRKTELNKKRNANVIKETSLGMSFLTVESQYRPSNSNQTQW